MLTVVPTRRFRLFDCSYIETAEGVLMFVAQMRMCIWFTEVVRPPPTLVSKL